MPKVIWIISQYSSTPETGVGGRHYYLARELANQGYKVYLIAASYTHLQRKSPSVEMSYDIQSIEKINFVWVKVPSYSQAHSKKRIFNWFFFAWKLRGLVNVIADKPDAVLCSSPSLVSFLGAKYLTKHFNAKLIFEVRDIWPMTLIELGGYSPRHPFVRLLQKIEDMAYRDSDRVISNLNNAVEHMVQRGMDKDKFAWIPNGFSLNEVQNNHELPDKISSRLPTDKFIIGYTGTIGVANALDSLMDAAELLKEHREIVFVLVGNGKDKVGFEELVALRKLDNVLFFDAIPKNCIQSILTKFDVLFVAAKKSILYKYGVSPNKLYEYLYAGKPIIYAIDSSKYLPVDGANAGISIPAENPQAIADAILKLKGLSFKQRAVLGQNGHEYALKNHDYEKLAVKLSKVLLE